MVFILALSSPLLGQKVDYVQLSTDFLTNIRYNKPTDNQEKLLAEVSVDELNAQLDTDQKKLVFWINIYNGFIQKILSDSPELYEDRGSFFKKEQISIIQKELSFADIEHGIIRGAQFEYFLGYISNPFAASYKKKLGVDERDYRIHFALNCGAKDCPPVAIYTLEDYDEQMDKSTERYLKRITDYDDEKNEAHSSSLFSWFRGDFDGKSGIIDILKKHDAVPEDKVIRRIVFKNYDWTLDLGNYIDL